MAKLTPQQAREKWTRNLSAATEDIRQGVQRVNVAPTQKAADNIDKMRARLLEAFDSGKVERGLRNATLEDWKAAMLDKGINNIGRGATAAASKLDSFYQQLFPYQDSLKGRIDSMPDVTLEDSIQRMVEWTRGMAQFEKS